MRISLSMKYMRIELLEPRQITCAPVKCAIKNSPTKYIPVYLNKMFEYNSFRCRGFFFYLRVMRRKKNFHYEIRDCAGRTLLKRSMGVAGLRRRFRRMAKNITDMVEDLSHTTGKLAKRFKKRELHFLVSLKNLSERVSILITNRLRNFMGDGAKFSVFRLLPELAVAHNGCFLKKIPRKKRRRRVFWKRPKPDLT